MRATLLTKRIATTCLQLNVKAKQKADLEKHLGHYDRIHMDYYRVPLPELEVPKVVHMLKYVQRKREDEDASNEDEEEFNEAIYDNERIIC